MLLNTPAYLIDEGIAALRAGDQSRARALLTRATQLDPQNEHAWLWLAGAAINHSERQSCLEQVLALNPNSAAAHQGLAEMGIMVAVAAMPTLPPLLAPPLSSSAGKKTIRLRPPAPAAEPPALAPALPRGADDTFLVEYIASEMRLLRPQSDIVREVADRLGGTWNEAERLVAYVQQQSHASTTGRYWLYGMMGVLALVGVFVLAGLYFFGKSLPPGMTPHLALERTSVRGMLAIAGGVFTWMGALLDLDWFMMNYRARVVVTVLGRGGARIFYGFMGAIMVVLGAILMGMH